MTAEFVALTAIDRCDRCGAQAYVRVQLPISRATLDFCAHHFHMHQTGLADAIPPPRRPLTTRAQPHLMHVHVHRPVLCVVCRAELPEGTVTGWLRCRTCGTPRDWQ